MKNKKLVFFTSLFAVTCLTACGGGKSPSSSAAPAPSSSAESSSSSSESSKLGPTPIILPDGGDPDVFDNREDYLPNELLLNHRLISVLPRETYQLRPIKQFKYDGSNVAFESKDPSIASVDETGLVKGVTAGETEIVAYDKDHPEFNTTVPVIVNASLSLLEAQMLGESFKAINEDGLTKLVDYEMYEKSIYKNDELVSYDRYDQRMVGSIDDGYFRIWETDAEVKTKDGSYDFTNYEWIFYTNPYFDTYIYHQTGDVKNYLRVPNQDYMDGSRVKPLEDILDNLFTSGSEIFTNMFGNAKLSKFTGLIQAEDETFYDTLFGSNGEGQMVMGCTIFFDDSEADQDDETRYGIPYGTPTPTEQGMRFTVIDNRVRSFAIDIVETYEIGDDHYREEYKIDHYYEDFTDESLYIPDRKQYTQVDSIFDV